MKSIKWNINAKGRAWTSDEILERLHFLEQLGRLEVHEGKLLWNDSERLTLLAMLLENVGLDKIKDVIGKDTWDVWFDEESISDEYMATRDQSKDN